MEKLFDVENFDRDIVHYQNYRKDYDYDKYWIELSPYLSQAIECRRKGTFNYVAIPEKVLQTFVWESKNIVEPKYKYFSAKEVTGLDHEFVLLLDMARELAGVPFNINSGYRTVAKNKAVGGVADSAHLTGLAVDIRARNGEETYKIISGAVSVGIPRIGINRKSQFVHLDIDTSKPSPTLYEY